MKISVESAEELALVLRAVRKSSRVRLDDLAKTVGVSKHCLLYTSDAADEL